MPKSNPVRSRWSVHCCATARPSVPPPPDRGAKDRSLSIIGSSPASCSPRSTCSPRTAASVRPARTSSSSRSACLTRRELRSTASVPGGSPARRRARKPLRSTAAVVAWAIDGAAIQPSDVGPADRGSRSSTHPNAPTRSPSAVAERSVANLPVATAVIQASMRCAVRSSVPARCRDRTSVGWAARVVSAAFSSVKAGLVADGVNTSGSWPANPNPSSSPSGACCPEASA